jgi:hypothetical protein
MDEVHTKVGRVNSFYWVSIYYNPPYTRCLVIRFMNIETKLFLQKFRPTHNCSGKWKCGEHKPCCHNAFKFNHFPQKLCIDWNAIKEKFVAMFIKESRNGVCRREYPYHIATSQSTLIAFSAKRMRRSKFHQGIFSSQFSSGNFMVEFVGQNFRTLWIGRQIDLTKVFIYLLFFRHVYAIYFSYMYI